MNECLVLFSSRHQTWRVVRRYEKLLLLRGVSVVFIEQVPESGSIGTRREPVEIFFSMRKALLLQLRPPSSPVFSGDVDTGPHRLREGKDANVSRHYLT